MFVKKFIVYFEFFGKRMKTEVVAINEEAAKLLVKEKIIFHKVEDGSRDFNEVLDQFFEIMGKK